MSLLNSFYAPMSMPWKLLQHKNAVMDGKIYPRHIKLYPTDRCNASCSFCSCKNLSRDVEIKTTELLQIIEHFHSLGTNAITLGGGGEPSIHPGLDLMFEKCKELDIQLGIITNGLKWSQKEEELLANKHLVWARMSIVDTESGKYDIERLHRFSKNLSQVDLSVYFTVTQNVHFDTAYAIAEIVDSLPNYTHIKFVEDVVGRAEKEMDIIKERVSGYPKVIMQYWKAAKPGNKNCLISKLRPLVAADGYVYPCCSVPHAIEQAMLMPERFRMCTWEEYNHDTFRFDGSACLNCHWNDYNEVLEQLTQTLKHERFI